MKKILFILVLTLISIGLFGQNTFKYVVNANGGITVGGALRVKIDSITSTAGNIVFWHGGAPLTAVPGVGAGTWGTITGSLANQIDLALALSSKANLSSPNFTGIVTGITAAMVGAMSTSHAANAITAPNIANWNTTYGWGNHAGLYALVGSLANYVPVTTTVNGHALSGNISVTAADLSLGNVDNTSDANKPISTATGIALSGKQATLVSTTNIKSVGGISLLGSGDIPVGGTGTVTSVAVTTANGVSASVANPTTAANMTFSLGAIAPTSVNTITLSGASTPTLAVTGTTVVSGTNTGDNATNTQYSGLVTNANHSGDATGSGALTIATGAVSLAKMANMATGSLIYRKSGGAGAPEVNSLATLKTDLGLTNTNSGDQTDISGNAATATKLYATKTINGIAFDGSTNITVPSNIAPSTSGNVMESNGSVWTSGTKKVATVDTAAMLLKYLRKHPLDSLGTVGTSVGFYNSSGDTINPYIPYAGRIDLDDAMASSHSGQGIFNVLDYGAVSNDGIADQSAIQAAVDAAAAYGIDPQGGRVVIPAGLYYMTDSVELRSSISIEADKHAAFYFPSNYKGCVWSMEAGNAVYYTSVKGGSYGDYYSSRTWRCIDLNGSNLTTSFAMFLTFSDMTIENCNIGINLICTSTGWINGNTFKDILIWRPNAGIQGKCEGTAELTDNVFTNIDIQMALGGVGSYGVKAWEGDYTIFDKIKVYDLNGSQKGMSIASSASSTFVSGNVGSIGTTFIDSSAVTTYQKLFGADLSLGYGSTIGWYNNQVSFYHTGNVLNVSAPYGFTLDAGTPIAYTPWSTGNVAAGTGITADMQSGCTYYNGGSAIDITAVPQIAAGYKDGTKMILVGSSDTNTLTLDDGNGLILSAQCVLGAGDSITLIYISALSGWVEVSRSNN